MPRPRHGTLYPGPSRGSARAERRGRQSMAGRDARPDAQTGRRPETPSLNTRSFDTRATLSVILQCLLIGRREQLTDRSGGAPSGQAGLSLCK
ncbi:unnamed protein product [Arctia plantaginis]|uniref:Uncharacterized protein n=1 Tax=Arctia plantaginis TaxID=874455 RepID=A0A8S0ZTP6_ARCPL|nr:unnamed protein product [Arctia plantaginis]